MAIRFPLRHQPFKALYLTYELITTLFLRLPAWYLISIPKSLRPRPSWTLQRCVWIRLCRHIGVITARTGTIRPIPNHHAITPGRDVRGVWIEPIPDALILDELRAWSTAASVSPVRIPGYWYHKKDSTISVGAPPMPGEKVVLTFHGGGYVWLSAHPNNVAAAISNGILEHSQTVHRVLSVEYRLSTASPYEPSNPFPAALLDALAGYYYLVHVVGFVPSDIIVEGDSAGGNLAHALTRYFVEHGGASNLPASPGGLILLSPWSDLSTSHDFPGSSRYSLRDIDYIGQDAGGFDYEHDAFLGPHGMGAASFNRYISPASLHPQMNISFVGFPRTFIVAGGGETLFDRIRTLTHRMVKDLGEGDGLSDNDGKVRYYEAADGVHDYILFPWHEPERTDTLTSLGKWIDMAG